MYKIINSFVIQIIFSSLLWGCSASDLTCDPIESTKGVHFMVGVIGSYGTPKNVQLILTTDADTNARVTAPFINYDKHHTLSKHLTIPLGVTITQITNSTEFKGIEIESDTPVSVVVATGTGQDVEGYIALPITQTSTDYVVASYAPFSYYDRFFSQFQIIGIYPDTFVDIQLPFVYTNDPKFAGSTRIELQPFETFQFRGRQDTTGTVIKSNKPISVISGSQCSDIPIKVGVCNRLMEQMVPTTFWDTSYILPAIYPRNPYMFRVFAKENNTEVVIYNGTNHEKVYINTYQYTEYLAHDKPSFIFANKPINVVQYAYDSDGKTGGPFMMNGQSVFQHLSRYEFTAQTFITQNTLAVAVKTMDLAGLKLDGKKDVIQAAHKMSVLSPVETYTVVFLPVKSGDFHVVEQERNQPFGAVLYGLGPDSAYGYPLQLRMRTSDCKTNGTQNATIQQKEIAQCFSCDDMTSLKYCDKVSSCNSVDQMCYVQRYKKSQGVMRYRSGCLAENKCNTTLPGECVSCCEGKYCNSYGCGDDGVQALAQRGPFCFACGHHGEHEACETIELCPSGQVCNVEKYRWGNIDMHYVKGCADAGVCSSKRYVTDYQWSRAVERSTPVCTSCCTKDFCNQNCTTSPSVSIIG